MPVDYEYSEKMPTEVQPVIGELELRDRMKFMLGISVYQGKSYLEVTFRAYEHYSTHKFIFIFCQYQCAYQ